MHTRVDHEAKLIEAMAIKLGGGEANFTEAELEVIREKAKTNKELRNRALIYLGGSSERAEYNLYLLHQTLVQHFFQGEKYRRHFEQVN